MNKHNFIKTIKIVTILFSSLFLVSLHLNSQTKIDSLKNQLERAEDPDKLEILIKLSKECWNVSPQKGLEYANQAAELAQILDNKPLEAKALLYGGVNAWFAGSYDLAIKTYQKSLAIAEAIDDKKLAAYNLNNLGMVNSHLENYEKAIGYYSKSSRIMDELGDDIEYAKVVNNIGKLNALMGDYDEALKNQLSILEQVEKSQERQFLLWLLCDIGMIYRDQKNNALARQYFSKALEVSREIDDTVGKSIVLGNLGRIALDNKEYDKAKHYFSNGLDLALKSLAKEEIKGHYKNLSDYHEAVGGYQKALENYQLYKVYSDSILNENKMNAIVEMETRYETESKEKENRLLRKDNEIRQLEIEKQTYLRNFFVALLLVAVIIIVVVYNQFHTKKQSNKQLNEKNALLEKTVQEKIEALHINELLLREMNHRVKNNLMVIQSLLNLQSKQLCDDASKSVLQDCATRVRAVSRIHGMLSTSTDLKEMQIGDYVSQLVYELASNFSIDESRVEINLDLEEIRLDADVLVPFALILNELVTNVFKYAFVNKAKGSLEISLSTDKENKIELIVKDNGAGLPEGFKIDQTKSMGMKIVTSLVEQIEGELAFHSQEKKGTEFKISFSNPV